MDLYANDAFPTNTKPDAEKLDALIIGAGVAGLYQLHLLRNQGLKVRAYDSAVGRRRHLVLEPLSGRAFRLRRLHLPVSVLGRAVQGMELERALPGPGGNRTVDALRRRPSRSP